MIITVIDKTRQKKTSTYKFPHISRRKVEWKHEITTTYILLRCNFCALADSWAAECSVLCHLFRCFDPRFKKNVLCYPAFVIRYINICRNSYSKGHLKSRKSYQCYRSYHCYKRQISYNTHHKTFRHLCRYQALQLLA